MDVPELETSEDGKEPPDVGVKLPELIAQVVPVVSDAVLYVDTKVVLL